MVKRYIADVATCVDVAPVESVSGAKFVLATDYAALEAENAKLKGEYEWVASINTALDESNQSAWAENAKLRAELERRAVDGWIPVSERLPESERTVLAFYLNSHGKGRRVRAEYIAAKTKSADDGWDSDEPADYDEQADEYFWPAGWYEVMDNWDDLTHMVIHEGEVTHWMPLPAAPSIAAARNEGGKV